MKTWKQRLLFLFTVFILFGGIVKANAKEIKGTIRNVRVGGIQTRILVIEVDTTGNRMPDHDLRFPDPAFGWSRNLQGFAEKDMEIVFDDEGSIVAPDGTIIINGDNTISIDGVNMIDLFPNEVARFKFAAKAKERKNRD